MAIIQVPDEYGYVLLAAVSTFFVGTWHGARVGSFRKAAKIPYPFEYASWEQVQTASPASKSAMLAFNAAQRSHQNFNENHVTFLGGLLVAGLRHPMAAAVIGGIWSLSRIVYAIGYTRSAEQGGKGRYYGATGSIAYVVMLLMSGKAAYDLVMG